MSIQLHRESTRRIVQLLLRSSPCFLHACNVHEGFLMVSHKAKHELRSRHFVVEEFAQLLVKRALNSYCRGRALEDAHEACSRMRR